MARNKLIETGRDEERPVFYASSALVRSSQLTFRTFAENQRVGLAAQRRRAVKSSGKFDKPARPAADRSHRRNKVRRMFCILITTGRFIFPCNSFPEQWIAASRHVPG